MSTVEDNTLEAKARARAEILAYRERNARERAAKLLADRSAEQEIEQEVHARRKWEADQEAVRAERARVYAEREVALERHRQEEKKFDLNRMVVAETRERRTAKVLRARLGDDFGEFLESVRTLNFPLLRIELLRVLDDERAEALHQERLAREAARLAEAAVVPEPEDAHELLILAHHGLTQG